MLIRELRWGLITRGTLMMRVFYVAFVVYFFVGAISIFTTQDATNLRPWLVFQCIVTVAATPALMANALTKERELGNLDMLRATLLRPHEIVLGKFFAAVFSASPAIVAALLSGLPIFALLRMNSLPVMSVGYGTLLVSSFVALSLGLFASLLVRRTDAALVLSYLFNIAVFAGIPIIESSVRFNFFGTFDEQSGLVSYSPIAAFMHATSVGRSRSIEIDYSFWMTSIVLYTIFAVVIVAISVRGFHKYKMQDN